MVRSEIHGEYPSARPLLAAVEREVGRGRDGTRQRVDCAVSRIGTPPDRDLQVIRRPTPAGNAVCMVSLCRLCGRVGTAGDGPGAPCRMCIDRAVGIVTGRWSRSPVRPDLRLPAGRGPEQLTVVERTMVAFALGRMRGRGSDIALAGALPLLVLELACRSLLRRSTIRPSATA